MGFFLIFFESELCFIISVVKAMTKYTARFLTLVFL